MAKNKAPRSKGGLKAAAFSGKRGAKGADGKVQVDTLAAQQQDGAAAEGPLVVTPRSSTAAASSVIGLNNLGNTCFFNSSVQLLLSCEPLQQLLLVEGQPLGKGPLGYALQQAFLNINGQRLPGSGGSSGAYNPQALLSAVCRHAPQFKGKQQHDSHELLRIMLDGLQNEEKRLHDMARMSNSGSTGPSAAEQDAAGSSQPQDKQQAQQQQGQQQPQQQQRPQQQAGQQQECEAESSLGSDLSRGVVAADVAGTDADIDGSTDTTEGTFTGLATMNGFAALAGPAANGLAQQPWASSEQEAGADCSTCSSCGSPMRQRQQQQPPPPQPPQEEEDDGSQEDVPAAAAGTAASHHNSTTNAGNPLLRGSLVPPPAPTAAGATTVDAVFGGVLSSTIRCSTCGHTSISYEPFLDLSVPIPVRSEEEGGSMSRKSSLLSRLTLRSRKPKEDAPAAVPEDGQAGQANQAEDGDAKKLSAQERKKLQAAAKYEKKVKKQLARAAAAKGGRVSPAAQQAKKQQQQKGGKAGSEAPADPSHTSSDDGAAAALGSPLSPSATPAATPRPAGAEASGADAAVDASGASSEADAHKAKGLHRRLGSLSSLTSLGSARGQLSALLGWHSRSNSRDSNSLDLQQPPTVAQLADALLSPEAAIPEHGPARLPKEPQRLQQPPFSVLGCSPPEPQALAGRGGAGARAAANGAAAAAPGSDAATTPSPTPGGAAAASTPPPGTPAGGLAGSAAPVGRGADSPTASAALTPSHAAADKPGQATAAATTPTAASAAPASANGAQSPPHHSNPSGTPFAAISSEPTRVLGRTSSMSSGSTDAPSALSCLAAFFEEEAVTWDCPKERADAKAARLSGVVPVPGTPLFKQVSFSAQSPRVVLVPGSVEQRGTDLSLALSGSAAFSRPVTATCGSASFLLTAQLGAIEVDGAAAAEKLVLKLAPAAGSRGAEAALAGAVAGSGVQGPPASPKGAAPASPTAAVLAAAAGGSSPTVTAMAVAAGEGLKLGELQLPRLKGLSPEDQGEVVQSVAVLALNCCAELLRHEGGVPGLRSMLAGGLVLLHAGGDAATGDSSSGWRLRGKLPAAGVVGRSPSSGGAVLGSSPARLPEAGYWEYPYDASSSSAASSASSFDDEGETGAANGASNGSSALNSGRQARQSDDIFDMDGEAALPHAAARGAAASTDNPAAAGGSSAATHHHQHHHYLHDKQPVVRRVVTPDPSWLQVQAASSPAPSSQPVAANGAAAAQPHSPLANGMGHSNAGNSSMNGTSTAHVTTPIPTANGTVSTAAHGMTAATTPAAAATNSPLRSQPVNITAPSPATPNTGALPEQQQPLGGTPSGLVRPSSLSKRTFSRAASKRYSVQVAPRVLMLHLKRFQADAKGRLTKLDTQVSFDFELDLTPFMAPSAPLSTSPLLYDLAGVVVHSGTMRSGHYIAYVKRATGSTPPPVSSVASSMLGALGVGKSAAAAAAEAAATGEQWFYVSDVSVKPVSRADVAACQAYMLMYVHRGGLEQQAGQQMPPPPPPQQQQQQWQAS